MASSITTTTYRLDISMATVPASSVHTVSTCTADAAVAIGDRRAPSVASGP